MASETVRRKTPAETAAQAPARPPIWAEGRQRPKFDLLAFASVATAMARLDLVPAIDDASTRLSGLGNRVASGELRVTGQWAKRILPSHQQVGAGILALHRSFVVARTLILVPESPAQAYPTLKPRVMDSPPPAPHAAVQKVEPTLHAIRSAIAAPPHDFAQERGQTQLTAALPAKPNLASAILARGLLAILMLFAWPGGAVRAMLYHLDGGDLRDWA